MAAQLAGDGTSGKSLSCQFSCDDDAGLYILVQSLLGTIVASLNNGRLGNPYYIDLINLP